MAADYTTLKEYKCTVCGLNYAVREGEEPQPITRRDDHTCKLVLVDDSRPIVAKEIINVIGRTSNDYDAAEEVEKVLAKWYG